MFENVPIVVRVHQSELKDKQFCILNYCKTQLYKSVVWSGDDNAFGNKSDIFA